jgi:hypothetical protein
MRGSQRADRAAQLAQRRRLLELEADLQRATLAATFETWRRRRALAWGTAIGSAGVGLLRQPRLRWLLFASLAARLRKNRERRP